MIAEIKKEIDQLESQYNIKILYAVESGSRAWGFASTNSDWDVRYIYIHPLEWYLKIDDKKDSQEKILDNDIDLAGWELRKALRLFRKSNPPMLEWLHSPIIYKETYTTAERLRELEKQFFNPKSCLHHYLHMAEGNYEQYLLGEQVRVKKYFYVLRPLLACDWIREHNTMAPTEFRPLLDRYVTDSQVKETIETLLVRKMSGEELSTEPANPVLQQYLEEKLAFYKEFVKDIAPQKPASTALLDKLFMDTLAEVWNK
ncbi:nucleotidyltransferase domain-containing protein [Chitinophaga sp. Cy-1792]|uniref:nucleotidyltransferase domain-containing protein n=1 Tax=Chitinophaga sp. Cy-1792 TaxID=2608339 RepID=UPI00196395FC|nr:nucleotidyltransferase domain-containing protein [Chitinophaga sp. Cy-1792]